MIPFILILSAVLLASLSLPLIKRKIPKNIFYGARFPQSFKSDEHWFEINHAGGKALLVSSLPIALFGVFGLFLSSTGRDYEIYGAIIVLASIFGSCAWSYWKARLIDREICNKRKSCEGK